jgi:hypothetical protein
MGHRRSLPSETAFFVIAFTKKKGRLVPDAPIPVSTEERARRLASDLAKRYPSVIALSRTGDPEAGRFNEPVEIVRYGDIPEGFFKS